MKHSISSCSHSSSMESMEMSRAWIKRLKKRTSQKNTTLLVLNWAKSLNNGQLELNSHLFHSILKFNGWRSSKKRKGLGARNIRALISTCPKWYLPSIKSYSIGNVAKRLRRKKLPTCFQRSSNLSEINGL